MATLVEVTLARATQVQAASAVVAAQYNLVLHRTLIANYVGDLDPANATLGKAVTKSKGGRRKLVILAV